MRATIQKWGDSLAIRLPSPLVTGAGLDEGMGVELRLSGSDLIVSKVDSSPSLDDLVSRITPENLPGETHWGAPVGAEPW